MNEQLAVDATAEVAAAQGKLDELLRIEKLLWTELPAAQAALRSAEKKLRELTRPSKAAIRKAELETLTARLAQAKGEPSHA
jgi:hypothetical protein